MRKSRFFLLFFIACFIVLFYEGIQVGQDQYEEWSAGEEYRQWIDGTKEKDNEGSCVDFEELQKEIPDLVAWVCIPDTKIDYPVVQGTDNSYYLTHTASGKENHTGSIFLDAGCDTNFQTENYIIYGHNLRSRKMFGSLKELYDPEYSQNASITKHRDILIYTARESIVYRVFSVRRIHLDRQKGIYVISFSDENARRQYVLEARKASLLTGEDPPESGNGSLLTLTTCSSEGEDSRFIVQAYEMERHSFHSSSYIHKNISKFGV